MESNRRPVWSINSADVQLTMMTRVAKVAGHHLRPSLAAAIFAQIVQTVGGHEYLERVTAGPVDRRPSPRDGKSCRFPRHLNGPPMNIVLQPWQLAFAILSGWVHQRQQQIIEFQNSEILSLMQSQGKKRMLLTDDQRREHHLERAHGAGRRWCRKLQLSGRQGH